MDKIKNKVRPAASFNQAERESIIKEYLLGHSSKVSIWKKYTGQEEEKGQMLRWMRQLGYISNAKRKIHIVLASTPTNQEEVNKTNSPADPTDLQKRVKELERQLEEAQLKVEGYQLMIETAEKELKIPIRKKSNTK